ncbi:MAG: oleate hydratase [Mycobacterium sp.]|jgi:oleate hydratase|nr:oleate hydratase [Mycobacterium sp.]MBV8293862.1 oleate hydratase [Mycobacterium sp.]
MEQKSAHIIGGGLAGLAVAAFLFDDAQMPAERVTVYESREVLGGA